MDMHSPVPVREAPSRGKGEVNGNKFQKKQRGSRGLCPQPWLPPDHPPWRLVGNPKRRKRRRQEDPGRGRDGKVSVKVGGRLGMECRWTVWQAGGSPQPGTDEGRRKEEWCLAGCWGGGRDAGRAHEAGGKAATKSESWTAAEEVARESLHGQKLREQDGDRAPPAPQWDDAGSRRALGLRGKLGGTAPSQGAPPSLEASS